ncbi:MAG: LOG family protein [Acidobacteriota bacterium]|nr:LOG family protein [Acidobacteriota bacterium]MDH3528654.1 LOG family protein [Acidobacteriota bacterium]
MFQDHEKMVTIFGGSKCGPGSAEYKQALEVGQRLAGAGYTICTGGYLGVMEAASKGARENGGRVLGVVMNQFRSEPNRFLTDKVATDHFYDRLQALIQRSMGFIAIRGGMGTVTEISLVWNKLQTGVLRDRPLVLLGECWSGVVESWKKNLVVSDSDVSLLRFAATPEQAVAFVTAGRESV